jgi:hypothetical protein
MSKIDRLKIALKTGAFWGMFKSAPVAAEFTQKLDEKEVKCRILWDKYRDLIWKYDQNNARFMALYDAYRRDLLRLLKRYETS